MPTPRARLTRRILLVGLAFAVIVAAGTVGYTLIEDWTPMEAAYMTIITLSTVGFGEVQPLTPQGRLFTIVVIVTGVGAAAYAFGSLTDYIVAGELQGTISARRLRGRMDKLNNHIIVCGYGRVGQQVVRELEQNKVPVVVIERELQRLPAHSTALVLPLHGDASDDDVLHSAGIEQARGLVAATNSEADNVFIILSARSLNRDLTIVARGLEPDAERKLRKAGADHVILPHAIGGRRMASVLMHPHVVDFLDVVMHSEELELWLEDITVSAAGQLAEQSVGAAAIRTRTGANILAIKTRGGKLITSVGAEYILNPGDIMVALGTRLQLRALEKLAGVAGN